MIYKLKHNRKIVIRHLILSEIFFILGFIFISILIIVKPYNTDEFSKAHFDGILIVAEAVRIMCIIFLVIFPIIEFLPLIKQELLLTEDSLSIKEKSILGKIEQKINSIFSAKSDIKISEISDIVILPDRFPERIFRSRTIAVMKKGQITPAFYFDMVSKKEAEEFKNVFSKITSLNS